MSLIAALLLLSASYSATSQIQSLGNLAPEDPFPTYAIERPEQRPEYEGFAGRYLMPLETESHGRELYLYDMATDELRLFADLAEGDGAGVSLSNPVVIDGERFYIACIESRAVNCNQSTIVTVSSASEQPQPHLERIPSTPFDWPFLFDWQTGLVYLQRIQGGFGAVNVVVRSGSTDVALNQNIPPLGHGTRLLGATDNEIYFMDQGKLYLTDGTIAGTFHTVDADLGDSYGVTSSHFVFESTDADIGEELFRSVPGTSSLELLADINPGPGGSEIQKIRSRSRSLLFANTGNCHYFLAEDPTFGKEVWCTDGTPIGTRRLTDIEPGSGSANINDLGVVFADNLALVANSGAAYSLWVMQDDGQTSAQLVGPVDWVKLLGPIGPELLFYVIALDQSRQLWKTDGTVAGTEMVMLLPDHAGTAPAYHGVFDGKALLSLKFAATGLELYTSDGTAAGTNLLADFFPGPTDSSPACLLGDDVVAICVADIAADQPRAWRLRPGMTAKPFGNIGRIDSGSDPGEFTGVQGIPYFTAETPDFGWEPWFLLPGENSAQIAHDITPGASSSDLYGIASFAGHAMLSAVNIHLHHAPAGLTDSFLQVPTDGSTTLRWPRVGASTSDTLFVSVLDNDSFPARWLAQVDAASMSATLALKDGQPITNPREIAASDDQVLVEATSRTMPDCRALYAYDPGSGDWSTWLDEFYDTDGGPAIAAAFGNVVHVGRDCREATEYQILITHFDSSGQVLTQFLGLDSPVSAGVYLLTDTALVPLQVIPSETRGNSYRNQLIAVDYASGTETYLLDTDQVFPLFLEGNQSAAVLADRLYFPWREDNGDIDLWVSDGTPAGTVKFKDIAAGSVQSAPSDFVQHHRFLYFTARTLEHGREIWRTDGTPAGTTLYAELVPGPTGSNPENLKVIGDFLYLSANMPGLGQEPFRIGIDQLFNDSLENP